MQDGCYDFPESLGVSEGESHDLESVHHGAVIVSVVDRGTLKPRVYSPLTCVQQYNYIKTFIVWSLYCPFTFNKITISIGLYIVNLYNNRHWELILK